MTKTKGNTGLKYKMITRHRRDTLGRDHEIQQIRQTEKPTRTHITITQNHNDNIFFRNN